MSDFKSNKISDLYQWFKSGLSDTPGEREQKAISNEVFFRFFGLSADQRILQADKRLPESDIVLLKKVQRRLNQGEPIQYITGITDFLSHLIYVQPCVLIPRQESEGLVLWLKENLWELIRQANRKIRILDVGTGSGCIAIALAAAFPDQEIMACDINKEILQVAKHNALINNTYINFFIFDVLSEDINIVLGESLDVVVSNPPYVRESEKPGMATRVLSHEPAKALFVPDDDALLFYRAISLKAMQWLVPGGRTYFEINEALGSQCVKQLEQAGYLEISIKKDIHGRERYLRARKPL